MATRGQPSPQPGHPVTPSTDCPQCGSLCLGPAALPCGHIICRKCLHDMLQQLGLQAACHRCGEHLDLPRNRAVTVNDLVKEMGTDPIMEQLVQQYLDDARDIRCLHCPNKQAVNVCLDCQEYYCDACSAIHGRGRSTSDHVLHLLLQAIHNDPGARTTPRPRPRPRSPSVLSTLSLDSIRNPLDPQPRDRSSDVKQWKEWVRKEMGLLQQASREKLTAKTTLQDILSLGQELMDQVDADEQILDAYQHHLPRFDVVQRTDPDTYIICATGSGVSMEVKTGSLARRLSDIRSGQCPDPHALETIRSQLDLLLHSADQEESPSATSTTPEGSPSTSPHTLTSSHLHPVTHPTTHIFTPSVDVMTASPRRMFTSSPTSPDDRKAPAITTMVCLPDDTLVMADFNNNKVKVMGVAPPHTVSASLFVREGTVSLALLSDGLIAVTTHRPLICLIKVTDTVTRTLLGRQKKTKVTMTSRTPTDRMYDGVAGQNDGHLLASCREDDTGPAAVHVLTRQGDVVRTIADSTTLTRLESPFFICDDGDNHVLVSDYSKHVVHRIEISSGHVTQSYDRTDMRRPTQVCADRAGNLYVGNEGDRCVLVRSRAGQWRQLLTSLASDPRYVHPWGLCLTSTGRLVVAWGVSSDDDSIVIGYDWV